MPARLDYPTEEGFAAIAETLPMNHELVHRAVKIPGLKIVFGTDAVAGAHGRNAEEFIDRVRDGGAGSDGGDGVRQFAWRGSDGNGGQNRLDRARACRRILSRSMAIR